MHLKNALYEGSARVPMIVAGPGSPRAAGSSLLVSLVDIYPTLMDLAGLPHPVGVVGYSLLPEIEGGAHPRRPGEVFSEYHSNFQNTSSFMLRRGEYKYIAYAGYEPQLFHLGEDADEMHNLVAERPAVAAEMAAGLRAIVDHDAVARDVQAYNRGRSRLATGRTRRRTRRRWHGSTKAGALARSGSSRSGSPRVRTGREPPESLPGGNMTQKMDGMTYAPKGKAEPVVGRASSFAATALEHGHIMACATLLRPAAR